MARYRLDSRNIIISESSPILQGGQGTVMIATLVCDQDTSDDSSVGPETKVAVKKLECQREGEDHRLFNVFVNELTIVTTLSHPNLAKLIGFAEDLENGITWMISPWEAYGNVRDFLASGTWEIPERVYLIMGTLRGIQYLHEQQPPICHGDLKADNILVNNSYEAVITDFGSARFVTSSTLPQSTRADSLEEEATQSLVKDASSPQVKFRGSTNELTLTGAKYTVRWAAPEVLTGEEPDLPSDIWAFGWICWEIITGRIPYPEEESWRAVIPRVVRQQLPPLHDNVEMSHIVSLCSIMTDCWSHDKTKRPSAKHCGSELRWIPATVPSAPDPNGGKVRSINSLYGVVAMQTAQDNLPAVENLLDEALNLSRLNEDLYSEFEVLDQLAAFQASQLKFREAKQTAGLMTAVSSQFWHNADEAMVFASARNFFLFPLKHEELQRLISRAQSIAEAMGDEIYQADTLVAQGFAYICQLEFGRAINIYMEALEIYTRQGNLRSAAVALIGLAFLHLVQGLPHMAEEFSRRSLEISARLGWRYGRAVGYSTMGAGCFFLGRDSEAENHLAQAKAIFEATGDENMKAVVVGALGCVYGAQAKYPEATANYKEACDVFERNGCNILHAIALADLGEMHDNQDRPDEAEEFYAKALLITNSMGPHSARAFRLSYLAQSFVDRGDYSNAETAFFDAAGTYALAGMEVNEAYALHKLAVFYTNRSENELAEEVSKQALATFTRLGINEGRAFHLVLLGVLSSSEREAVELIGEAIDLYESIGNEEERRKAIHFWYKVQGGLCRLVMRLAVKSFALCLLFAFVIFLIFVLALVIFKFLRLLV